VHAASDETEEGVTERSVPHSPEPGYIVSETLHDLLPDADAVLGLEPEELAGPVMTWLNRWAALDPERRNVVSTESVMGDEHYQHYAEKSRDSLRRAVMEAWQWLEREGFVAPSPDHVGHSNAYFITRRGRRVSKPDDVAAYRKSSMFPRGWLYPAVAQNAYPPFLRGAYDTAVFEAFREVEIQVRAAGGYGDAEIGVQLMRDAFQPARGPLRDTAIEMGEREAMMHLFAGAIGLFKSPSSHRRVGRNAEETVELLALASRLLKIVDERREAIAPGPAADSPPPDAADVT
jgi:uncharacterized protein (TIGR02391 family)